MKVYMKPDMEIISLVAEEEITTHPITDGVDGELGVELVGSLIWEPTP